jgi:glycosyltransferase involved in cell wall biosynthesis
VENIVSKGLDKIRADETEVPTVYGDYSVAVIIPVFNQARFLSDSIMSVMAQTRPADEVIVVDDGSTDDPGQVVATFSDVRLIRQHNRGLSAARNVGLRSSKSTHVVFLDADDRLRPIALQAGLDFARLWPNCAFVYGGYHHISEDGSAWGSDVLNPVNGDAHLQFLRRNLIGVPSCALYRRDCLLALGGFDETLRRVEDHDIYLRITQKFPVASHSQIVAEYRKHGHNMSSHLSEQLKAALEVLDRHSTRIATDLLALAALKEGRKNKREYYVSAMLSKARAGWRSGHDLQKLAKDLIEAVRWAPLYTAREVVGSLGRHIKRRSRKVLRGSA